MSIPTDLADHASPALTRVLKRILDDPERDEAATLATVRKAVSHGLVDAMIRRGELDESERDGVPEELDKLIEEHGEAVAAVHLLGFRASGPMSRLIRQLAARRADPEYPVTLGDVRAAIEAGLAAELVGEGLLDPEEEDELGPEADRLIRMYGEEALAEELLSPEGDMAGS
jgi:hypothetical protein